MDKNGFFDCILEYAKKSIVKAARKNKLSNFTQNGITSGYWRHPSITYY